MATIKGKCHCGKCEYNVKVEDKSHVLCHCDACKTINGGEFTLNQIVPKENFELTKGQLTDYVYSGDSGNPVHCYFCPACSTHVYHHQTVMGPKYIIRTATLEGSKEWPVSAEVYGKDNLKWQPKIADEKHVFPEGPPA